MARTVLARYAVLWRAAASCSVMSRGKLWRATSCGNCRWETGNRVVCAAAELAQGTTRCSQQEIRTPCSCAKALTRGPGGRYDHQAHSTYICQSHIRMRWHPHTHTTPHINDHRMAMSACGWRTVVVERLCNAYRARAEHVVGWERCHG